MKILGHIYNIYVIERFLNIFVNTLNTCDPVIEDLPAKTITACPLVISMNIMKDIIGNRQREPATYSWPK